MLLLLVRWGAALTLYAAGASLLMLGYYRGAAWVCKKLAENDLSSS